MILLQLSWIQPGHLSCLPTGSPGSVGLHPSPTQALLPAVGGFDVTHTRTDSSTEEDTV